MKESVIERNARLGVDKKIADFIVKQRAPRNVLEKLRHRVL